MEASHKKCVSAAPSVLMSQGRALQKYRTCNIPLIRFHVRLPRDLHPALFTDSFSGRAALGVSTQFLSGGPRGRAPWRDRVSPSVFTPTSSWPTSFTQHRNIAARSSWSARFAGNTPQSSTRKVSPFAAMLSTPTHSKQRDLEDADDDVTQVSTGDPRNPTPYLGIPMRMSYVV